MNGEDSQKAVFKDEKTQQQLNTPLADPTGISEEDANFLEQVVSMINEGKIDLFKTETLLNKEVYDKLDDIKQGKVDIAVVNLLSSLRNIKDLYDNGFKDSYQMQNLVEQVHETKKRLEAESGDVFII